MELLKKLFSKGISDVVNSVGDIVDRFTLTKEEWLSMQPDRKNP